MATITVCIGDLEKAAEWFRSTAENPCSPDCQQCKAERTAYECINAVLDACYSDTNVGDAFIDQTV